MLKIMCKIKGYHKTYDVITGQETVRGQQTKETTSSITLKQTRRRSHKKRRKLLNNEKVQKNQTMRSKETETKSSGKDVKQRTEIIFCVILIKPYLTRLQVVETWSLDPGLDICHKSLLHKWAWSWDVGEVTT